MADIPPDDALGRAERDPVFRARVAAAYRGEHGVMDALWWRAHPGTVSPAGTPPPSAELRRLEALVFGRPVDATGTAGAAETTAAARLEELRARHDAERAAIDQAVDAASVEDAPAVSPGGDPAGARRVDGHSQDHGHSHSDLDDDAADSDDDHPTPAVPPWWARRPVLVLGTCAVLLGALVGAAVTMAGAYLAAGDAPLAGPAATGTPASDAAGGGGTVDSPAALRVFDREQVPSDLPPELRTVRLRETTFRPLGPSGTGWLYAARDVDDGVCLVLVTPAGTYTASCVPQDRFPADGILLRASIDSADPADDGFSDLEVRWLPDGSVTGERTSR